MLEFCKEAKSLDFDVIFPNFQMLALISCSKTSNMVEIKNKATSVGLVLQTACVQALAKGRTQV